LSALPAYFRKIWWFFDRHQRRTYIGLTAIMVLGAGLEVAGIGLLIPLLALMTQPDLLTKQPALQPLLDLLDRPGQSQLVMIAMAAFMAINLIRIGTLAGSAWLQSQFVKQFIIGLSLRLYAGYLSQPYTFHMQRNSAQLMRNTTGEIAMVAGLVQNTLGLSTEVLVLVALIFLLLTVDPLGVLLVMTLLGGAAWWFHQLTRHRIQVWGRQRQQAEDMRIQQLQQGFGGVKEIKLLGLESFILNEYAPHNLGSAHANQRQTFVQAMPRLWLELLAILGMGLYVIAVLAEGKPMETLVPTLGVFGAAAFRLMPSVNRILGAMQGIRYGNPSLEHLTNEVRDFDQVSCPPVAPPRRSGVFRQAIIIDHVSYTYPTGHKPALDQVTITIPLGAAVGFIGGSGAGKSTLIDLILGLLPATEGAVRVDGVDIRERLREWQGEIGYVPQTIYLTDDSLRRNIAFGLPAEQIDEAAVQKAIKLAQLESFVQDLPQGADTQVGERGVRLSGGQRQRIGIARALYYDPPILVLDEATSALDNATEEDLMHAVNALHGQKTVLIVAHRLTTVSRCDQIYRLDEGRVIDSGPPRAVLGNLLLDRSNGISCEV